MSKKRIFEQHGAGRKGEERWAIWKILAKKDWMGDLQRWSWARKSRSGGCGELDLESPYMESGTGAGEVMGELVVIVRVDQQKLRRMS